MARNTSQWEVRDFFTYHPLYVRETKADDRPMEVWANPKSDGTRGDKVKLYCTPCLDYQVGQIALVDESDHQTGRIPAIRTRKEIERYLFNLPKSSRPSEPHWMENRTTTLLRHASKCERQSPDTRARARDNLLSASPSKGHRGEHAVPGAPTMHQPVPNPFPALYLQQPSTFVPAGPSHAAFVSGAPMPVSQPVFNSDTFQTGSSSSQVTPSYMAPPSFQYHLMEIPSRSSSVAPSISGVSRTGSYGHGSQASSSSRYAGRGAKKGRLASEQSVSDLRNTASLEGRQIAFNTQLVRLTASAGLPLNWVTNPEFHKLVEILDPSIVIPGRKKLTQTLLPEFMKDVRAFTKSRAHNRTVTIQCDGWSGINNVHLIAFMATTTDDVFTLKVYETTTDRKTAENLVAQMEEQILVIRIEYKGRTSAVTTDASGEAQKARRMLAEKYPELVIPDCFAHQINLLVGDYFRADNANFLVWADMANELITWLRSKTAILGLIRNELISRKMKPMSVIRPVPTRWTAYYLAYTRLLTLRTTLVNIVEDDARKPASERLILQPSHDRSTREKAQKMIDLINNSLLWHSLQRIKRHLEPLAVAANVTQAAHCRLDEVGMTVAKLYLEFSKLNESSDAGVQAALFASLEKRWKKCDQDVIIAAIILNPYVKTAPFKPTSPWAAPAGIKVLIGRLWKRFFKEDPPNELFTDLKEYIQPTIKDGMFTLLNSACVYNRSEAASKGKSVNPVDDYNDVCNPNIPEAERPPLWRLAMHIFSVCPNSASCERLFSSFGLILTKLRSRLSNSTLVNLAEAKMHIRNEHLASGAAKSDIRTRAFGFKKQRLASPNTAATPAAGPATEPLIASNQDLAGVDGPADEDTLMADPPTDVDVDQPLAMSNTPNRSSQALRALTRSLANLSEVDDLDEDPVGQTQLGPGAPTQTHPLPLPVSGMLDKKVQIKDLFDFTSRYWSEYEQRTGRISLDEEMELYELLDLDGHGDLDPGPDLDDTVASVFHM